MSRANAIDASCIGESGALLRIHCFRHVAVHKAVTGSILHGVDIVVASGSVAATRDLILHSRAVGNQLAIRSRAQCCYGRSRASGTRPCSTRLTCCKACSRLNSHLRGRERICRSRVATNQDSGDVFGTARGVCNLSSLEIANATARLIRRPSPARTTRSTVTRWHALRVAPTVEYLRAEASSACVKVTLNRI